MGQTGTQALDYARTAAAQPFQIPAAPVANFTDDQLSAFADMRNDRRLAQPYMNQAQGLFTQSAAPISAAQIGNYLNPYASFITSGLENLFGQQRRDATGRLTAAAGGAGADRIALAQGNMAREQAQGLGQTLAGIYQPALAAAQADAQRQQSAAYGLGQLGTAAQNAALQGSQAVLGAGNQQQALDQARLMSPYNQRLAELEYPFKVSQFLSGINSQTAGSLGGTTTNTYPGQSPWGTIAGLGMTAAGAYMGNPGMVKGGMSMMGSGGMGGASQGPMGYGGYQPGMSAGPGFSWQPAPHGPGSMAPMAWSRGGAVNPYDMGQPYQAGGDVIDMVPDEQGINWSVPSPGSFGDRFAGAYDNPQARAAMEFGNPIPESAAETPDLQLAPPMGSQGLPPEITGTDEGLPSGALGYAAAPRAMPALPPPTASVIPDSPYTLGPDPDEGSFARSPGLALMNAGLATMAAAGKRDSRGLPLPPFAAIGEGGMKGIETLKVQDQLGTQRRRVDLEAKRLLQQAEHQRATLAETSRYHRATEGHQAGQLAIQQAQERRAAASHEIALKALQAGEKAISDPKVLESVGITPAQAALLGPQGVRAAVQSMVTSRYDFKEVEGELWAIDRLNPQNRIRLNAEGGGDRFGLGSGPSSTAPSSSTGAQTSPRPRLGTAGQTKPDQTPSNYAGAYGPASVLTWLGLKSTDITTGTASERTFNDTVARHDLSSLRDRIIASLTHGRPEGRLRMVQERINKLLPEPGKFFTGPQEGLAAFSSIMKDIDNDIAVQNRITDPKSTGYDKKAKAEAGKTLLELHSVRNQIVNIMKLMAIPNEIRSNPGLRVTQSGAIVIPDPKNPGKWLQWQP